MGDHEIVGRGRGEWDPPIGICVEASYGEELRAGGSQLTSQVSWLGVLASWRGSIL